MRTIFSNTTFLFTLLFSVIGLFSVSCTYGLDEFSDYLPKYRKFNANYQIDKIEYRKSSTVIFFRFVVQKTEDHAFYGASHPQSWYLRTPPRNRSYRQKYHQNELANIAVNNEIILNSLSNIPEVHYQFNKGDVVTCELHFDRFDAQIRMLDLIDGEGGDWDKRKFNCFDIMIKTKNNPLLGKSENVQLLVSSFEKTFDYTQPKVDRVEPIVASTSAASNPFAKTKKRSSSASITGSTTVVSSRGHSRINGSKATEPIDYMPSALKSSDDLQCNTRIYMPNVVFKENEVRFSGRLRAIQNLKIIVEYLDDYKDARINLYGHTDIYGNKKRNMELSKERAIFVKRELVKMGASSAQINTFYFGGEQPLKKYPYGSDLNRRVEVEPICSK